MSSINYQCENMLIHSRACYVLQNGKRVYIETEKRVDTDDTWFEFEATMFPPLMLLPFAWKRYEYTIEDVYNTYEKLDASYMWQMALMLLCGQNEVESVSTGIRFTFQSLFTFLTISRKTVFTAMIDSQSGFICKRQGSSLCTERPDHRPLLPKIQVDQRQYDEACFMVPEHFPSFRRVTLYEKFVPFKDILMVPVEYDRQNDLVLMHRVVPKRVYDTLPVKPRVCAVTMDVIVKSRATGDEPFIMVDEACFFESHERKRKSKTTVSFMKSPIIKRARHDS